MSNQLEQRHAESIIFTRVTRSKELRGRSNDRWVESSRVEAKVFHRGWVKKERKRGNVASIGRSSHESLLRSIALHPILQGLIGGGKVHHGLWESWVREKCMARCTTPRVAFPSPHVTDTRYKLAELLSLSQLEAPEKIGITAFWST